MKRQKYIKGEAKIHKGKKKKKKLKSKGEKRKTTSREGNAASKHSSYHIGIDVPGKIYIFLWWIHSQVQLSSFPSLLHQWVLRIHQDNSHGFCARTYTLCAHFCGGPLMFWVSFDLSNLKNDAFSVFVFLQSLIIRVGLCIVSGKSSSDIKVRMTLLCI